MFVAVTMFNYLLSALSLAGVSLALVAPQPLALSNGKVSAGQHERTGLGYLRLPVHKKNPTTRNAANRKRQDVGLPLENVISSYSITRESSSQLKQPSIRKSLLI